MSLAQPIVKYVDGFTVTGFSVQTQNSIEFDEKTAKLPKLWQTFNSNNPTIDETVLGFIQIMNLMSMVSTLLLLVFPVKMR